jgi:hypothetical protein
MNFEQQLLTGMARDQAKLGKEFAAVGEATMARMQYESAIEKLEMAKKEGGHHDALNQTIRQLREELSGLGKSPHGAKCSTALSNNQGGVIDL